MAGLAGKLTDVMLALAGDPIVSAPREDDEVAAGDYGYRYPVRAWRPGIRSSGGMMERCYDWILCRAHEACALAQGGLGLGGWNARV